MTNPNFTATLSTNDLYRNLDTSRCLTDDLDTIEADILALETAIGDGAGGGDYAAANHTHSEYALATDLTALQTTVAGKSDVNHTHSGYASSEHNHDADYADIDHTHSASDITGLSTGNNGITESGTSGIWTYEKYDNGKLVCEGLLTCSGVFNKRYWEMRYRDATETYPVAFVGSAPMVQATAQCDIGFPQVTVYNNTLTTIGVRAFNPHDPVHDVKVAIRAVGKWK